MNGRPWVRANILIHPHAAPQVPIPAGRMKTCSWRIIEICGLRMFAAVSQVSYQLRERAESLGNTAT